LADRDHQDDHGHGGQGRRQTAKARSLAEQLAIGWPKEVSELHEIILDH
jgi:hypothetical protein